MTFKNLMNNSTSHLMSMLCKSSTSKYMIMVRNVIDEIMKIMIKLIIKNIYIYIYLQSLGTKIVIYLKNYHVQCTGLRLIRHTFDAKYSFLDILYVYGELHNLWMY